MRARLATLLLAACVAGGCASLADRIVDPPHDRAFDAIVTPQVEGTFGVQHARWRSRAGIDLAYRVIPAAHRGMTYTLTRTTTSTGFRFALDPSQAAPMRERGTIIYLHGWSMDGRSMLPWAFALHGTRDSWIPPAASRSLALAAPRMHYVELPDENHMTLPVRIDWLGTPLAAWLDAVGSGQCPALALPPDPARPST